MLHFKITKELIETLPEKDYETIEMAQDGEVRLYKLRPLLARFMTDENGQPIQQNVALKQLGEIPLAQWQDVIRIFAEALKTGTVPNQSGNSSNSPSEPVSEI